MVYHTQSKIETNPKKARKEISRDKAINRIRPRDNLGVKTMINYD